MFALSLTLILSHQDHKCHHRHASDVLDGRGDAVVSEDGCLLHIHIQGVCILVFPMHAHACFMPNVVLVSCSCFSVFLFSYLSLSYTFNLSSRMCEKVCIILYRVYFTTAGNKKKLCARRFKLFILICCFRNRFQEKKQRTIFLVSRACSCVYSFKMCELLPLFV